MRKLILEKLQELGLTMSEASLKIGKNHAYLQQFLKRGYPLELPEKSRIPLAKLIGVSEEALRGPSSALPTRNHTKPDKPETKISTRRSGIAQPSISSMEQQNFLDSMRPLPNMTAPDLPVFGMVQDSDGTLILTGRPVDWVSMPDFLAKVEGAYGMIMFGNSMDPEHKNGSTILVNPNLPARNGDTCIFRCRRHDGTELATVKHLVHFNNSTWHVRQHNPKKNFSLKRTEWSICHVTIGNYNRR